MENDDRIKEHEGKWARKVNEETMGCCCGEIIHKSKNVYAEREAES